MERNKRTARTLTAALCLALLAGCGAETAGESLDADEMHPGWSTVTTDPSAYGITYQELEDLSGMPLDQLTAYCLGADGVYGENGFDQLYHRFLEAPDTVLSYLALIDSREERELLCTHLASADVSWYGGTEAFGAILDRLAGESGTSGELAELIQTECCMAATLGPHCWGFVPLYTKVVRLRPSFIGIRVFLPPRKVLGGFP